MSSSSRRPERIQNTPIPHILSILLMLIASIFLFVVVLNNVPLSLSHSTIHSHPERRSWLVKIKPDIGSGSKGSTGGARREFGLGVWGWCSWTSRFGDGVTSTTTEYSEAQCTKEPFWKLPDDADRGDPIRDLTLPSGLAKSLSISAFFLVFVLISCTILLFDLLLCLRFHSYTQPPKNGELYCLPPSHLRMRTWYAHTLRNVWMRLIFSLTLLAWGLPVIVIACVGLDGLDERYKGYLGSGWGLALGALICAVLAQILIVAGGLWNNPDRSGTAH
ncbi:hypothetical protein I317_01910 [Kwoniella heveanensis CBS 569]|nr:hypothetical protein I317_01910 [Kwoniella heveanensis CBS 569]